MYLPDIVEIPMWHSLLSFEFIHFIQHHVQLEPRLKVAQPSIAKRFAVGEERMYLKKRVGPLQLSGAHLEKLSRGEKLNVDGGGGGGEGYDTLHARRVWGHASPGKS